jgi:hypothetical protein
MKDPTITWQAHNQEFWIWLNGPQSIKHFLLGRIVIPKVIVDIVTKGLVGKTFLFHYGNEQEAFFQPKLVEMVS